MTGPHGERPDNPIANAVTSSIGFKIEMDFVVRHDHEVGQWVAFSPVLDLYSQGDTKEEALRNIHEAVSLFLGTCYEQGTLNQVLRERGFQQAGPEPADPYTIPLTTNEAQGKYAEAAASQL